MLATMKDHKSNCSGCPCCSSAMAAHLSMSAVEKVEWAKSQAQKVRNNSAAVRTFRHAGVKDAVALPPRGYSLALARLRAQASAPATLPKPAADPTLAPRPYELALAKIGKGAIQESEVLRTPGGSPRPYATEIQRRKNRQ